MLEHKEHFHGSDLEKIEKIYGIKKEDIVSFSANVNPLGISGTLKKELSDNLDVITSYPDREYTDLREAIALYIGSEAKYIAVGNGSTELISIMMQITKPRHALLLAPSYSEYEHELTIAGGNYEYFELKESNNFVPDYDELIGKLTPSIDLLIMCNPNNPTSYGISRGDMSAILSHCKENNITVMVDETYVEFAPDVSDISSVSLTYEYDNLIILRGISKFFAAPGLRLGYAVSTDTQLLDTINAKKNPWTINSLAAVAGRIMFTDTEYIKATRQLILSERNKIMTFLNTKKDLKYYVPYGNFILVNILRDDITAQDVFENAIKEGLMIRNCASFQFLNEHYFRFCFMMPDDNQKLLTVIDRMFR